MYSRTHTHPHARALSAEWFARTNICDVKRAVSCKIVRHVYYGPLPYDFITDIFFALIKSAIDGVDNSSQKPQWEAGEDTPVAETFIMSGTPIYEEIYAFCTDNEKSALSEINDTLLQTWEDTFM